MFRLYTTLVMIAAILVGISACGDDSTGPDEDQPSITVENQGTVSGNQVMASSVFAQQNGWIVVHQDNNGSPGAVIGQSFVEGGNNSDVQIQLEESVSNNEQLWMMLHEDTGTANEYEFSGSGSVDQPVMVDGAPLVMSFTIQQTDPELTSVPNQSNDGAFEVDVNAAEDGWVVLHQTNPSGGGPGQVVGHQQVTAGTNTDVSIALDEGQSISAGGMLFAMLHYDTGTEGEYEFDGQNGLDLPVVFDENVVVKPFTVQAN